MTQILAQILKALLGEPTSPAGVSSSVPQPNDSKETLCKRWLYKLQNK